MPAKVSFDEFVKRARFMHGKKYKYSRKSYSGTAKHVLIKCPEHGVFKQIAKKHVLGQQCPKCARLSKKITFEDFVQKANKIHNGRYGYKKSTYAGATNKVTIICKEHGEFDQIGSQHLRGHGCAQCAFDKQRLTPASILKTAQQKHGNRYGYDFDSYVGSNLPMTVICPKHGPFSQIVTNHLINGHGCPKCSFGKKSSFIEKRVANFIKKYERVSLINRSIIKPKELDIVVPKKKLAIEINGVYWHNEKHKPRKYHYDKMRLCESKGYQLLQFWENELLDKPAVCKSVILSKLGHNHTLGARKLQIRELSTEEAKEFFDETHLQGFRAAKVYIGLVQGDWIYAAMSFSAHKKYQWELVRYSCALYYNVVGGASRLLAHFEREYIPKQLLTFADLRISNGNLYKHLGFQLTHTSQPNYAWSKKQAILTRYRTQKHLLPRLLGDNFDQNKSETQNMQQNGWHRVFDAGNLVFVKTY